MSRSFIAVKVTPKALLRKCSIFSRDRTVRIGQALTDTISWNLGKNESRWNEVGQLMFCTMNYSTTVPVPYSLDLGAVNLNLSPVRVWVAIAKEDGQTSTVLWRHLSANRCAAVERATSTKRCNTWQAQRSDESSQEVLGEKTENKEGRFKKERHLTWFGGFS